MSVFETLITDRTAEDVTNRTVKGCIAYTDLNRVETACRDLAGILLVDINTKTDWTMRDFRTDSDMQRIRGNIQHRRESNISPLRKPTISSRFLQISMRCISPPCPGRGGLRSVWGQSQSETGGNTWH